MVNKFDAAITERLNVAQKEIEMTDTVSITIKIPKPPENHGDVTTVKPDVPHKEYTKEFGWVSWNSDLISDNPLAYAPIKQMLTRVQWVAIFKRGETSSQRFDNEANCRKHCPNATSFHPITLEEYI